MNRFLFPLVALALLALVLPATPAGAENPDYRDKVKEFKSAFKTKNPLKTRRGAVKALSKSQDGRAVKDLLKVVKTQAKQAKKLRKEWVMEEEAWQEKTLRLEKQVAKKFETASGGRISVTDEEDDWLGLTDKWKQPGAGRPKSITEKNRIEGLYKRVLEEEGLVAYIFKSVATLINSLEGEEQDKALKDAASAAKRAKDTQVGHFIHLLAYVVGEPATDALIAFSKDTSPAIAIPALEAMGRQNSEKGLDVLVQRLEDPRWQLRAAAIKGLSYFKDPRAMDALIAAAKKEEGVVQRKYFAALARIVQENVPGTVEAWDSFWTENREDYIKRWAKWPKGQPVEGDPPDIPIDTSLGSTSFYGIRTNSKHIIFVVDISGSMGSEMAGKNEADEAPIDVARKELKGAIKSLSATDEDERGAASFNIVIYSKTFTVYKPGKMIKATMSAKEKAFDWIDENIKASGATNIYDSVEAAFNIISDRKESKSFKKGADTIFLMTDGRPNRGKFTQTDLILIEIKRLNKARKLTIHTVGVGPGADPVFLSRLAAQNDGQYLAR